MKSNFKLRPVIAMLRNHSDVKETGSNPVVFEGIGKAEVLSDVNDVGDVIFNPLDKRSRTGDSVIVNDAASDASPTSPTNENQNPKPPLMQSCSICGEKLEVFI